MEAQAARLREEMVTFVKNSVRDLPRNVVLQAVVREGEGGRIKVRAYLKRACLDESKVLHHNKGECKSLFLTYFKHVANTFSFLRHPQELQSRYSVRLL